MRPMTPSVRKSTVRPLAMAMKRVAMVDSLVEMHTTMTGRMESVR